MMNRCTKFQVNCGSFQDFMMSESVVFDLYIYTVCRLQIILNIYAVYMTKVVHLEDILSTSNYFLWPVDKFTPIRGFKILKQERTKHAAYVIYEHVVFYFYTMKIMIVREWKHPFLLFEIIHNIKRIVIGCLLFNNHVCNLIMNILYKCQ